MAVGGVGWGVCHGQNHRQHGEVADEAYQCHDAALAGGGVVVAGVAEVVVGEEFVHEVDDAAFVVG